MYGFGSFLSFPKEASVNKMSYNETREQNFFVAGGPSSCSSCCSFVFLLLKKCCLCGAKIKIGKII